MNNMCTLRFYQAFCGFQIFHIYLLDLQLKFAINGIQKCSQVHVKISVPKGIKFVGHPGKHHLTRKKCVAPGEAKPTSIVLSFNELGLSNITGSIEIKIACCLKGFDKCFFLILFQKKTLTSLVPQSGIISFHLLPTQLFNLICFLETDSIAVTHGRVYEQTSGDSLDISIA